MSTQEHGSQLNNLIVGNRLIDDFDGDDTVQHSVPGAVDRTTLATTAIRSRISYLPIRWSMAVVGDYNGFSYCGWTEIRRGLSGAFS